MSLRIYRVNTDYCRYLRNFDARVPFNDEDKEKRPFVGIVLSISGFDYFAPLSSPKAKFVGMKNSIDLLKINGGEYGVINFNNMLPVIACELNQVDMKISDLDSADERSYKMLLRAQIDWCNANNDKIYKRALRVYSVITSGKADKFLAKRCCCFSVLETAVLSYSQSNCEEK